MSRGNGGGRKKSPVTGLELHRGSYRWRPVVEGKRLTIPLVAKTIEAAIAEVGELRRRPIRLPSGNWEELVDEYLRSRVAVRKMGEGTAKMRRPVLLKIGREMDLRGPRSLTPALVRRWVGKLETAEELSKSSRSDYVKYLRGLVSWCLLRRKLLVDPFDELEVPHAEAKLRDVFLPAAGVAKLLAAARLNGDRDMEFILALGFELGFRRGEIDAARPEWFDLRAGTVRIPPLDEVSAWQRKGREGRRREAVVPLSQVVLEIIARHQLQRPYVVAPDKDWGDHVYRFEFRFRFRKLVRENGLKHLTIHDMRRSFASNRVSAGVPLNKVANWMGISLRTAEKRYARYLPADEEINRGSATAPRKAPAETAVAAGSLEERLRRLKGLLDEGLITADEWQAKRAEVLRDL